MALLVKGAAAHPVHCGGCGVPIVYGCKLVSVFTCKLLVIGLLRSRRDMLFAHRSLLLGSRLCVNAACPVKACMIIDHSIIDHGIVNISVMNYSSIYINNSRVVAEVSAVPSSAAIPVTTVPISIINPTIKTYMKAPVARMETINTPSKTPISWRP